MFDQKLILISLILLELTVEKCSLLCLTANDTNRSKSDRSLSFNSSVAVNSSSARNEAASSAHRKVRLKPNQTSRLQEEDESDDNEDYPDNEGIDGQSEEGLDEEGAEQEEGESEIQTLDEQVVLISQP